MVDCLAFGDAAEKSGDLVVGFFPLEPDGLHVAQKDVAIVPKLVYALFKPSDVNLGAGKAHKCFYTPVHNPVSNLCETRKHARIVPPLMNPPLLAVSPSSLDLNYCYCCGKTLTRLSPGRAFSSQKRRDQRGGKRLFSDEPQNARDLECRHTAHRSTATSTRAKAAT